MQPPPHLLIIHSAGDRDAGGEQGTHSDLNLKLYDWLHNNPESNEK